MMAYTTSLEVSKKLEEAGFEPKAEFYWVPTGTVKDWKPQYEVKHKSQIKFFKHAIPAYNLGELIRELPDGLALQKRHEERYEIFKPAITLGYKEIIAEADTPEDAAALAWLALQKPNTGK